METHKKLQPKLVPGYTYKQVELLKEIMKQGKDVDIAIVSYDEKPGLQAIGNKYPDLMPVEEKYSSVSRDYEYIRYGTISLLAGIDPLTGIRVSSKEELIARICQYFNEINETPIIFKWKYKRDEMPGGIEVL